jgi:RNA polymerase sigma-70 factor (ECF subfamily)
VNGQRSQEVTLLLHAWRGGDQGALAKLMPLVYAELHRLAHRYVLREHAGHNLQATAVVNEAYLRLIDAQQVEWKDRAHFFAMSAHVMRRILVEFARGRGRNKRGGDVRKVELDEVFAASPQQATDLVALDDSLTALAAMDERKAKVIELRFFGGLSVEETAEVLNVSADTVMRDWKLAKIWLWREMKQGAEPNEA